VDDELAAAIVPFAEALGADPSDVAWVPNVTFGLNLIARSLMGRLEPGDEVLVTDLEYGSQLMLWHWVCERSGAVLRLAPIAGTPPHEIADVIVGCTSPATRVALVSHVTSASAQRLPVEDVGRRLRERGVVVVVDGAHAPGQIDLDLPQLGAVQARLRLSRHRVDVVLRHDAKAQERVDAALPQLRRALQTSGLEVGVLQVDRSSEGNAA